MITLVLASVLVKLIDRGSFLVKNHSRIGAKHLEQMNKVGVGESDFKLSVIA